MPLGDQFKNTYWEDPRSKKVRSAVEQQTTEDTTYNWDLRKPKIEEGFGNTQNPQGMMFDPYSYTGLKKDPTVPREERLNAIVKALRLEPSVETPKTQQPNARIRRRTKSDSVKVRNLKKDAIRNAADELDIPTHEYEHNIKAPTSPTHWNKGEASHTNRITVGVRPRVEETTTERTAYAPSDKPIPNKKFWKQYNDKIDHPGNIHSLLHQGKSTWGISKSGEHVLWTSPSGEVNTIDDLHDNIFDKYPDDFPYEDSQIEYLHKEGYLPNIYPGKGTGNEKEAVGKQVKVESGYTSLGYGYTHQTWHTRHVPDKSVPPVTEKVVTRKNLGYEANSSTLAHEIGHTTEPTSYDTYRTNHSRRREWVNVDPVSEGYADALDDRAFRYSDQFEHHLTNPKTRADDIKTTGYTSSYHMWSAPERALYSAVRYHLAANPKDADKLATRQGLMEQYGRPNDRHQYNETDLAQQIMLGHMYETHPHIRPVLDELGFSKTAKKAHEEFMSRGTRPSYRGSSGVRGFRKPKQEEQGKLF
jgi:hypothetical protein